MSYFLDFTHSALQDIEEHKLSGNKPIIRKLFIILNELIEHPFYGTGKPEPLKYQLVGLWSMRLNKEHRLIYEVLSDSVIILSAKGHYNM